MTQSLIYLSCWIMMISPNRRKALWEQPLLSQNRNPRSEKVFDIKLYPALFVIWFLFSADFCAGTMHRRINKTVKVFPRDTFLWCLVNQSRDWCHHCMISHSPVFAPMCVHSFLFVMFSHPKCRLMSPLRDLEPSCFRGFSSTTVVSWWVTKLTRICVDG